MSGSREKSCFALQVGVSLITMMNSLDLKRAAVKFILCVLVAVCHSHG